MAPLTNGGPTGGHQEPAAVVARRYEWFGAAAGVVIAAAWHTGFDLVGVVTSFGAYRWPWMSVSTWILYTAAATAFAVLLLRRRPSVSGPVASTHPDRQGVDPGARPSRWPRLWAWVAAGLALSISVLVLQACPTGSEITPANWGWGSVGWLAVLALWHRPLRELVGFIAANALVTLAAMAARGTVDREAIAAWLMVVVDGATLQLGFSLGARMLIATSAQVGERAAELSLLAVLHARERATRATRARLAAAIHADAFPLLRELAAGACSQDERIRHRCAVSAARVRRLILETRGSPDPLKDELRAAADIAASRGVVVDLDMHGDVPSLSSTDLQALTEAPLRALAGARDRARVTVAGLDRQVVVGVLSDATDVITTDLILPRSVSVAVRRFDSGRQSWIESSWTDQSRLP